MIIRHTILLAAAILATSANADTIGLHVASWHSEPGFNNINPGAYWRGDSGLTVGAYCNSQSRSARYPDAPQCKVAAYAGLSFDAGPVSLTAGVITGYEAGTMPMLIPSVKLGMFRVAVLPKISPKQQTNVVHFMLESEL